ncbi:MAG: alkaline phosphatase [Deltaproteobacteria bacterium]|jgi:alkaline phosphatase|nr:alkaline phosphatase [Deltaproteobacteria bacterium]
MVNNQPKRIKVLVLFGLIFIGACVDRIIDPISFNQPPIADAGFEKLVTLQSSPIQLDGHASHDLDGKPLSFFWELKSKPDESDAYLVEPKSVTPYLSVDLVGTYEVSLVVQNELAVSEVDTVAITVVNNAKNIILLIGDGMGFEQVRAAGMYRHGSDGTLSFESFPFHGRVSTHSASGVPTDSAAAATAMATGRKVNNGVISSAIPGDGSPLMTILERFKAKGAVTGLLTTTTITHATPAAFGAHEFSRKNQFEIGRDYLLESQPDILMGGAQFVDSASALEAGYTVVTSRESLFSLDRGRSQKVWGQFGATNLPYEGDGLGDLPHLSEMVETALDILDNDPDGFFLMVEGGRIDHAGHINDLYKNIFETLEFSRASRVVLDWASTNKDTLVIVTADHETGGLTVKENNGLGVLPDVIWKTTDHTSNDVPVYALGVNADQVNTAIDNTFIYELMLSTAFGN